MNSKRYLSQLKTTANHFAREQKCNYLACKSFIDPALNLNPDIHWLFVLTFPNGGSTALAKLLSTASAAKALSDNCEGQWVVPSLSADGKRWDSKHKVWQRKLRASWLNKIGDTNGAPALVVEKSPTNMCRYQYLLSTFSGMKCSLMTFSRDPYAVCASWHKRYGAQTIIDTWFPHAKERIKSEETYFGFLAEIWLERAAMLVEAQNNAMFNLRYEDFTGDVIAEMSKLRSLIPELHDMSDEAFVQVKDYEPQPIKNMNDRQIQTLNTAQIAALSEAFSQSPEVLEMLGYQVR